VEEALLDRRVTGKTAVMRFPVIRLRHLAAVVEPTGVLRQRVYQRQARL